ncbi:OLC1v1031384C1 [Oldenlandia corymbosa var. corymbosa]|uniref:OLC1v1031384C1 n=1 Tax=Oldenlandia corymbosa var. corymbosa TaxID=529605 RepID=A0AAV1CKA8_OLDCO|nr:OLC1v1031384C1 [Oldenlandia corymbosa var. corymbosa]
MAIFIIYRLLRNVNDWIYLSWWPEDHGNHRNRLPPGDLGWPLIGNMISLFTAFKFGRPNSLISSTFTTRFGKAPMYRAFLFGKPCIIVTTAEACRKVLTDERFGGSWPKSLTILLGKRGFHGVSNQERKRLRRQIAAPILASPESLSLFIDYIDGIAKNAFSTWEQMEKPIELLTEMRKTVFKVMINVILGDEINEDQELMDCLANDNASLSHGLKSMTINLPGFAFHRALKARKRLVETFAGFVAQRTASMAKEGNDDESKKKKNLLSLMIEIQDDEGNKLSDEDIIDLMIIFLMAGHETSAHAITWAIIFLQENPQILEKAKGEQEKIVQNRSSSSKDLSYNEVKQMKYLQKVIIETLRLVNLSITLFREATTDINMDGYRIPKGWRVLPWIRSVHLDPENHKNPMEFNPSRMDEEKNKLGTLIPFGAGSRLCPGADLAKLQISVFLHHFLLNYRMERINPGGKVQYLPAPRPADKCLARIMRLSTGSSETAKKLV